MKKQLFVITTTLLITTIALAATATAQKKLTWPNMDALLIPYYEDGNWGWCDTTGKVVIKPQFKEVSFFRKEDGVNGQFVATVKTKVGNNFYVLNKGLIVPKNVGFVSFISSMDLPIERNWCIVKTTSRKFGIIELTKSDYALTPKWDSIIQIQEFKNTVYLRDNKRLRLVGYNLLSDSLFETDIISTYMTMFDDPSTEERALVDIFVFKHENGELTRIKDGVHISVTKEEQANFFNDNDFFGGPSGIPISQVKPSEINRSVIVSLSSSSEIIDSINGIVACYLNGSTVPCTYMDYIYKIVKKNNLIGVIAPSGEQILPANFDKLDFRNTEKDIILYKGDRIGIKLLYPPFSLIDAKYDSIKPSVSLKIDSAEKFQVFEVILNGRSLFVGENGAEYFKR